MITHVNTSAPLTSDPVPHALQANDTLASWRKREHPTPDTRHALLAWLRHMTRPLH